MEQNTKAWFSMADINMCAEEKNENYNIGTVSQDYTSSGSINQWATPVNNDGVNIPEEFNKFKGR